MIPLHTHNNTPPPHCLANLLLIALLLAVAPATTAHAAPQEPRISLPPLRGTPPPKPTPTPIRIADHLPIRSTSPTPYFRIGYLRPSARGALGHDWFARLRQALRTNPRFAQEMRNEGVRDVSLRPCDGRENMLQRLDQAEFDLLFCPAMIYVEERVANPERYAPGEFKIPADRYQVIFRSYRPEYDRDPSSSGRAERLSILFARRSARLNNLSVKQLMGQTSSTLAAASLYETTYFYARKTLAEKYGIASPLALICGSQLNAVKTVLSGLCDVGVCEESILKDVLRTAAPNDGREIDLQNNRYVRVLDDSQRVPTDPVLMRAAWEPNASGSLGDAAREVIQSVYRAASHDDATPWLRPTFDEDEPSEAYEAMAVDLKEWRKSAVERTR